MKTEKAMQSLKQTNRSPIAPGGLQPAIRMVMMPCDVNPLGTIFGGLILSSIDLAGVVEARRHSDRMLVTAAMHAVKFIASVFVGDLVSFYTETANIGRTSITIASPWKPPGPPPRMRSCG